MTDGPKVDNPHQEETISRESLDRHIQKSSQTLYALDQLACGISLNPDGSIQIDKQYDPNQVIDPNYRSNLKGLFDRFYDNNELCAEQYRQDGNVIDARQVHGAVVVVYDSSVGLPAGFSSNNERGMCSDPSNFWTQDKTGQARQLTRLNLITIDINPNLRQDGVEPTTTFQHEFHHYTLAICDYLISQDQQIAMASAYRTGRNFILFGANEDRLTTQEAFELDRKQYAELEGCLPEKIENSEINKQLGYLDELHSSLLQEKPEWISANGFVYNNRGQKGKYNEVVGHNPDSIQSATKLLAYIQAFYICRQVISTFSQNTSIGEGEQYLIQELPNLVFRVAAEIGVARTTGQACRLVEMEWQKFASSQWGSRLVQNSNLMAWVREIAESQWASPALKDVFFREK